MIPLSTGSHQILTRKDNGVKVVDSRGEMLEASWETYATTLANAPNAEDFIKSLQIIVGAAKIELSKPSRVVYARDTRGSSSRLVSALEDGLRAMNAIQRNIGITTTPILHYTVNAINIKNTPENYDFEKEYFERLSNAFKTLVVCPALSGLEVCIRHMLHLVW
jgi:phosphoacetylglucosamine mutase